MTTVGRSDRTSAATSDPGLPRSGDVLHVTRDASVQFRAGIHFRVIRVLDWPTYTGWVWLDGYELNDTGEATERRSIFVQPAGLQWASEPPRIARTPRRAPPRG